MARWNVHGTPGKLSASCAVASVSTWLSGVRNPKTNPSAPAARYDCASPASRVSSAPEVVNESVSRSITRSGRSVLRLIALTVDAGGHRPSLAMSAHTSSRSAPPA